MSNLTYVQFLLRSTGFNEFLPSNHVIKLFKRVAGHDTTFSNHLVPQPSDINDEDFTTTLLRGFKY